jgi:hypothetical protein
MHPLSLQRRHWLSSYTPRLTHQCLLLLRHQGVETYGGVHLGCEDDPGSAPDPAHSKLVALSTGVQLSLASQDEAWLIPYKI